MQNINNNNSTDSSFQWVTIYKAENTLEANIVKGLIQTAGIECKIKGEIMSIMDQHLIFVGRVRR